MNAAVHRSKRGGNFDAMHRKAHARGARHMVLQGLALYYQSLVHGVIEDTPSYLDRVMRRARGKDRPHDRDLRTRRRRAGPLTHS